MVSFRSARLYRWTIDFATVHGVVDVDSEALITLQRDRSSRSQSRHADAARAACMLSAERNAVDRTVRHVPASPLTALLSSAYGQTLSVRQCWAVCASVPPSCKKSTVSEVPDPI